MKRRKMMLWSKAKASYYCVLSFDTEDIKMKVVECRIN